MHPFLKRTSLQLFFLFVILLITPKIAQAQTSCTADLNGDRVVDLSDYTALIADFLKWPPANVKSDVNKDQRVDLTDYSILATQFLKPCNAVTTAATATPMATATPIAMATATPPNGTAIDGALGVGTGNYGPEIGINLDAFNKIKADAATGMYDRACTAAEHDNTKWHTLVNTEKKCHYNHIHGDDPSYANDIFGPPGDWFDRPGQSISYPWQTFVLPAGANRNITPEQAGATNGKMENDFKHEGYVWIVRRNQTCEAGEWCITDSRLLSHNMHSFPGEAETRWHSFSFEGRLCKNPNDKSTCGIYKTGGWTDMGQLTTMAPEHGCWIELNKRTAGAAHVIPLPADNQFEPIDGGNGSKELDEMRCHKMITDAIVKANPNGMARTAESPEEWWAHGGTDFRFIIKTFDPIGNVMETSPGSAQIAKSFYCSPTDPVCRWNGSRIANSQGYVTHIWEFYEGLDGNYNRKADSDGNGRTDVTKAKKFFSSRGDSTAGCTAASSLCIPLIIDNVILNLGPEARYVNSQCDTCAVVDHDLTPAGRVSWLNWFFTK